MELEMALAKIVEVIRQENDGKHLDFMIPPYAAHKVFAYQSMRQDLLLCKDSLLKLRDEKNDFVISSCLFYTVIVLYGKCFTDSSGSKAPKLEKKDFDHNHQHLLDAHQELMELRHNFIAHRAHTRRNWISLHQTEC